MKYRSRLANLVALSVCLVAVGNAQADPAKLPAFLAGCWQGKSDQGETIAERYTTPTAGEIFGMVTTSKDDAITFFEFIRIYAVDGEFILQPYPNGKMTAVVFELTEVEADKLTFANPAHDFPQLISYRLTGKDTLLTRVAGNVRGRTVLNEYTTTRVACR